MQTRSFVPVVRSVTPPPSMPEASGVPDGLSVATSDSPWTTTAEDHSSGPRSRTLDYGTGFASLEFPLVTQTK